MRPSQAFAGLALPMVLLSACMVGPRYQKRTYDTAITYSGALNGDTTDPTGWTAFYGDPVLVQLIRTTLDSNRTLRLAAARVEEARLMAGAVKADLYPRLSASATAGGGSTGSGARQLGAGVDGGYFELLGRLDWEVDLWGRLRHSNRAALAAFHEQTALRNGIQVSLVAEVASNYFLLRDLDQRLTVTRRTLEVRHENTRIISARFEEGWTSEVDRLQAIQQEQTAAAAIPALERQIRLVENALRVLQGLGPGPVVRGTPNDQQRLLAEPIPMGLPSRLLERRPDIIAAEHTVQRLTERAGVAQAERFPALRLTGILGFASPELAGLLGGGAGIANGFGGIAAPLFQWNQRRFLANAARQRIVEATAELDQTVLNAFADVDNALESYRTYTVENEARMKQVEAARKQLELSMARYDHGYTSYVEVILAENNLLGAELEESATRGRRLSSVAQVYRALGGGW